MRNRNKNFTNCNNKVKAMNYNAGRSMYNRSMMNPAGGTRNTMQYDNCCRKEVDYGCRKEMDCGCMKEMDHGCMKEMDHSCRKEMDCGYKKEMDCGCMKEMDCGCMKEMDHGCRKEMDCGCKKEMECGCMKELSCDKEMQCDCEMTLNCGCQKNMGCGCEVELNCNCEIERNCGCNKDMSCGCQDNKCCSSGMSHEEFYCLLHQLLQYEEGAEEEFCKAKKELQEVLGHLQYGIGCNTKIAELYCMINEWLDCFERENSCQSSCNNNCRTMRCELHEMVEAIHCLQKESYSHAYAACQTLMEAKKLSECMLDFREKVMRNCYPRQCK